MNRLAAMHRHPSTLRAELDREAGDLADWLAAARSATEQPAPAAVLARARAAVAAPALVPMARRKAASLWIAAGAGILVALAGALDGTTKSEPETTALEYRVELPSLVPWNAGPDSLQGVLYLQREGMADFVPNPSHVGWGLRPGDAVRYVGFGNANIQFDICRLELAPSSTVRFESSQQGEPRFQVLEGQVRLEGQGQTPQLLVPEQAVGCGGLPNALTLRAGQVSERHQGVWRIAEPNPDPAAKR